MLDAEQIVNGAGGSALDMALDTQQNTPHNERDAAVPLLDLLAA
jgi:hypothetical protein